MTPLEQLRQATELLPAGTSLTVTREALLEVLAGAGPADLPERAAGDLTVLQLAEHLRRRPSTVRGWLEAGLFPGAYHLPASGKLSKMGRPKVGAWRVPVAAVVAFVARQGAAAPAADPLPRRIPASLGDWRRALPRSEPPAEG